MNILEKLKTNLNFSALKKQVAIKNLANADTPNYKAEKLKLSETSSQLELFRTQPRHLFATKNSSFIKSKKGSPNIEGNTVSREAEMLHIQEANQSTERSFALFKSLLDLYKDPNKMAR
jgi:flagellar basal-body rod protein FlgB